MTSEKRKILSAEAEKNLHLSKGAGIKIKGLPTKGKGINTRDQIAEEMNWSHSKLARADIVNKKADLETKQKISNNDITIHQAYSDIKKQEKKVEFFIPFVYISF